MPKTTLLTPAVVCSKKNGLQIRIRSGGHDYAGISYVSDVPFIILDMFNLRSITVDMNEQTAWVQTGATLGELYYSIWKKSKVHAFPAGVCPTVGVGGHVSGAGYGNMLRKYGLTTDNVVDARIVDKTISVFWVERTLEENATDIVYRWQQVAPTTDENLFMRMLIQPSTSKVNKGAKTIKATIIAEFLGKADDVVALLGKEFPELGLKKEDVKEMSWIDSVLWWNQNNGTPEFLLDRNPNSANYVRRKSDYVQTPIPKASLTGTRQPHSNSGKISVCFGRFGEFRGVSAEADLPDSMEKSSTVIPFVGESHRIWRQILPMSFEREEPERVTRMYGEEASKSSRERVAAEEREREKNKEENK
uniref:FAD-binding PCMH-type domain-containing protein n=1 Tax=Fagus sylvatica TaxID=28930 RepID=A0A2N9J935_FAGSY